MHDNLPLKHVSHETFCVNVNYADVYCCSVIVVQCMTNCIGSLKLCHAWEFVCGKPHYNIPACACPSQSECECVIYTNVYIAVCNAWHANCIGSLKLCHAWEIIAGSHTTISLHVFTERGATPQLSWQEVLILHILDTRVFSCEDSLSPVRKCHFRSRDSCYKPVTSLYGIQLGYTHHTLTCICTCVLTHTCMHAYIHVPGISVCAQIQMDNNGQMDKGTQELGQALTNS